MKVIEQLDDRERLQIGFPSPFGELVMKTEAEQVQLVLQQSGFPSPFGELVMKVEQL